MDVHLETVDRAMESLGSGPDGLSETETRVRLAKHGPNELREKEKISPLKILAAQFNSFIVFILVGAVVVSVVLAEYIAKLDSSPFFKDVALRKHSKHDRDGQFVIDFRLEMEAVI